MLECNPNVVTYYIDIEQKRKHSEKLNGIKSYMDIVDEDRAYKQGLQERLIEAKKHGEIYQWFMDTDINIYGGIKYKKLKVVYKWDGTNNWLMNYLTKKY